MSGKLNNLSLNHTAEVGLCPVEGLCALPLRKASPSAATSVRCQLGPFSARFGFHSHFSTTLFNVQFNSFDCCSTWRSCCAILKKNLQRVSCADVVRGRPHIWVGIIIILTNFTFSCLSEHSVAPASRPSWTSKCGVFVPASLPDRPLPNIM